MSSVVEKQEAAEISSEGSPKMRVCFLLGHPYIDRRPRTIQIVNDTMKDVEVVECLIPKGQKWNALYDTCISMGITCARQISKNDYEQALIDANPKVVVSLGWPFIVGDKVVGKHPFVINAHASELPKYRGNYPFFDILMNKEQQTGNTIHHVDLGMDTGKIILQECVELTPYDTYLSVADKAIGLENKNIPIILQKIVDGEDISGYEQDEDKVTLTNRGPFFKEEWHQLDPNMSLGDAMLKVRAHNPLTGLNPFFYDENGEKVFVKMWREEKKEGTDFPNSF